MTYRMRNTMITFWNEPKQIPDTANYMVFQCEIAPTTKLEHFQAYVEWKDKMTMKAIKEAFNDATIHIEERRGTQKQAIEYCTKEDTRKPNAKPIHWGKPKLQGSRNDLDAIVEDIENGKTAKEILIKHQGHALKHINMIQKGLEVYHKMYEMDRYIVFTRQNPNVPEEVKLEEVEADEFNMYQKLEDKPNKTMIEKKFCELKAKQLEDKSSNCLPKGKHLEVSQKCPEVDGNTARPLSLHEKVNRHRNYHSEIYDGS